MTKYEVLNDYFKISQVNGRTIKTLISLDSQLNDLAKRNKIIDIKFTSALCGEDLIHSALVTMEALND